MGRQPSGMAHTDRRNSNHRRIADVCQIRDDAVSIGLRLTTQRWRLRYTVDFIENVVFYRIHKSLLEGSAQYEVDGD